MHETLNFPSAKPRAGIYKDYWRKGNDFSAENFGASGEWKMAKWPKGEWTMANEGDGKGHGGGEFGFALGVGMGG